MSVCEKIERCTKCEQIIRTSHKGQHVCDQFTCPTCKVTDDRITHFCYIQPIKEDDDKDKKKKKEKSTLIFFDFETQPDLQIGENQHGPTFKHVPPSTFKHVSRTVFATIAKTRNWDIAATVARIGTCSKAPTV